MTINTHTATLLQHSDPLDGYVTCNGTTRYDSLAHGRAVVEKFPDSLSRYILEEFAERTITPTELLAQGMTEEMFAQAAEDVLVALDYCLHRLKSRQAESLEHKRN